MSEILNRNMSILEPEMALICDCAGEQILKKVKNFANAIISDYGRSGRTNNDGLPFWGSDASCKAIIEEPGKRAKFQESCQELREQMKEHL